MPLKIKIKEMAFSRQDIMREAKAQFPTILKHWILVSWAAKNDPENKDFTHWQDELVTALWNVGSMRLTKGNVRETVRKAINEMYFTKMQVQDMSLYPQVHRICQIEHVDLDESVYEVAFKIALPQMVKVMASNDYGTITEYVDNLATPKET